MLQHKEKNFLKLVHSSISEYPLCLSFMLVTQMCTCDETSSLHHKVLLTVSQILANEPNYSLYKLCH